MEMNFLGNIFTKTIINTSQSMCYGVSEKTLFDEGYPNTFKKWKMKQLTMFSPSSFLGFL